jgi:hypothetical protein
MTKHVASTIFLLALFNLLTMGCKKEEATKILLQVNYKFKIGKYSWASDPFYSHIDTVYYFGSLEYHVQDTLKINYLDNCSLYTIIDSNNRMTNCRLVGTLNYAHYGINGTFNNENELHFSFFNGGLGGGTNYDITGEKD